MFELRRGLRGSAARSTSHPSASLSARNDRYTSRLFGWALNRDVYGPTASPCDRARITDLIGSPKARERMLDPGELVA